jgi:ABC-type amino acid transport substrate-binding protein
MRTRQIITAAIVLTLSATLLSSSLEEIKQRGVIRHLGIPYANFVTGNSEGMESDIVKLFASSIGVRYEYVQTDWGTVISDLIGRKVKSKGNDVEFLEKTEIKGDIIANGFTILPWRQKAVLFSTTTFPSQIWLIAKAESNVKPIKPTGNIDEDIKATRGLMKNKGVLSMEKTCLDPALYNLSETGARITCYKGNLNELAPAVINGVAELTILDVPDALVALSKWPGKIKIIGPISDKQFMAAAFPHEAHDLHKTYNAFLDKIMNDGTYMSIVKKHYPTAPLYFLQFFKDKK